MFKKIRKILVLGRLSQRLYIKVEENHKTIMGLRDAPQPKGKSDAEFFLKLRKSISDKAQKVRRRLERVDSLRSQLIKKVFA